MDIKKGKKRVCLALGFVQAEDAISKIISEKYENKLEIVQNVRSKESLLDTVTKEKFEIIILREDLPGNIDLIEILKTIKSSAEDTQIIFFMNNRQNGDPFFIELFLFNIYDFVVLPNIRLDEVFGFIENPRSFKEIVRFLPTRPKRIRNLTIEANNNMKAPLKMDKDGDIDEILDINIPLVSRSELPKEAPLPLIAEVKQLVNEEVIAENSHIISKEASTPLITESPSSEINSEEIVPDVVNTESKKVIDNTNKSEEKFKKEYNSNLNKIEEVELILDDDEEDDI